ncbi:MAG: hypothetical protein EOO16_08845 [Chitinophagaceae bacterium]|nr:MAG: hypothetical protein EOO16_08845 [Chitinophagaceae bacterium]
MNRIFTPFDIVWIKNVSNTSAGQAYLNLPVNEFLLHFPNRHQTNASSPAAGEIILLYQTVNNQRVFTHLVTPIDEIVHEDNTRQDYRFGRNVRIIAATPATNLIPVATTQWERVNFQGISQGNACRIENILGIGNYDLLLEDIWSWFSPYFKIPASLAATTSINQELDVLDPDLGVTEGRLRLIKHLARERNMEIVKRKKEEALAAGNLICEVCAFSFYDIYGAHYIECHHLTPISEGGVRETKLSDLALVCSNCHRMLHKRIGGQFLSLSQLREVMEQRKCVETSDKVLGAVSEL